LSQSQDLCYRGRKNVQWPLEEASREGMAVGYCVGLRRSGTHGRELDT
jgi:hypothetical protein